MFPASYATANHAEAKRAYDTFIFSKNSKWKLVWAPPRIKLNSQVSTKKLSKQWKSKYIF